jgi:AAA domain
LAGGAGRIVMLDTEHRASTLYADAYTFDLVPLRAPFEPQRYVAALPAVARRYEVVIIDSASHEWAGPGGCLAQVAHRMASGHAPSRAVAWQQVVSTHHQFMQALIQCPAHLLVTLRATTAYALELTSQGTWAPQAIGLAPIQCEEVLYAFDVVGRLESVALDEPPRAVRLTITSTHYPPLYGRVWDHPDEAVGRRIQAWLHTGAMSSPPHPATMRLPVAAPVPEPSKREGSAQPLGLERTSSAETAHEGQPHPPASRDTRAEMSAPPTSTRGALLQQIQTELFRQMPARTAAGRAARRAVLQTVFGGDSLQALSRLPLAVLGRGLRALLARQPALGSG